MKLRSVVGALVVAMIMATMAFAADVVLKDGTVIKAKAYTVNGSYVMVELPTGAKVAYSVTDVDLAATRRATKKTATATKEKPAAALPANSMLLARAKPGTKATLSITDQDVTHVETGPPLSGESGEKKENAGGTVIVENVRVEPGAAKGAWVVRGDVLNQMKKIAVSDVRVDLMAKVPGAPPLPKAQKLVAGSLGPGAKAPFSYMFTSPTKPQVTVQLHWLQPQAPAPAPRRIVERKKAPRKVKRPKRGPAALRWGGPPPSPPGVTPGGQGY
ncbi:MAG: hypothetical protein GXP48_10670 [Acidobacteria bacterium]|nr:hypothetical protein [Acidobacteriota bacterium]